MYNTLQDIAANQMKEDIEYGNYNRSTSYQLSCRQKLSLTLNTLVSMMNISHSKTPSGKE